MKRMAKISLLVVAIGMIAWFASMNGGVIMHADGMYAVAASDQEPADGVERVTLSVDGMTCRSCVPGIRRALLSIPGVKYAQINFAAAQAVVEYEAGKVTDAQLVKAIEDESSLFLTFKARVISRK